MRQPTGSIELFRIPDRYGGGKFSTTWLLSLLVNLGGRPTRGPSLIWPKNWRQVFPKVSRKVSRSWRGPLRAHYFLNHSNLNGYSSVSLSTRG
jgi:hypothetical protein